MVRAGGSLLKEGTDHVPVEAADGECQQDGDLHHPEDTDRLPFDIHVVILEAAVGPLYGLASSHDDRRERLLISAAGLDRLAPALQGLTSVGPGRGTTSTAHAGLTIRDMEQASPPIEAVVAVLRRGDRFLVIQRAREVILPGYWAPPSGRIEAGETQEQAVVREVVEELGLEATPLKKVWECLTDDGAFRLHWWTATAGPGEGRLDPGEVAEARWVTVDELMDLRPTFAGDRKFFVRVVPALD